MTAMFSSRDTGDNFTWFIFSVFETGSVNQNAARAFPAKKFGWPKSAGETTNRFQSSLDAAANGAAIGTYYDVEVVW